MKRICIFSQFPLSALHEGYTGRGGGQAATWLPQLAMEWEHETDFEIHWIVFERSARNLGTLRVWNQYFHQVPCCGVSASMLLLRWPHRLAARRLIKQIDPDLIHCWGTETLFGAALMEFRGPSLLSMQGIVGTYAKTGDLKGWRWKLFEHWESLSIRRATLVTTETRWGRDRVKEIVPGKSVKMVEYGVFPGYFDAQWMPAPTEPRILFVGGLNRLKGVDILLDMLKMHPRLPWKMVFVGDGNLMADLRSLSHPSIEVLGLLNTTQVQHEMAKAWCLVIPSRADTSPNVVKEARVIGLPVIGSPNGGHAEYIEHGIDGLIVQTEEPDQWLQAINALGTDYQLCRSMGAAKHGVFRAHFRPKKTAELFLGIYRSLTSTCP